MVGPNLTASLFDLTAQIAQEADGANHYRESRASILFGTTTTPADHFLPVCSGTSIVGATPNTRLHVRVRCAASANPASCAASVHERPWNAASTACSMRAHSSHARNDVPVWATNRWRKWLGDRWTLAATSSEPERRRQSRVHPRECCGDAPILAWRHRRIARDATDRALGELRHLRIGRSCGVLGMQLPHGVASFGIRQQGDIDSCKALPERRATRGVRLDEQRRHRRAATIEAVTAVWQDHHAPRLARFGPAFGLDPEVALHRQRDLDRMVGMVLHRRQVATDPQAAARPADDAPDAHDGTFARSRCVSVRFHPIRSAHLFKITAVVVPRMRPDQSGLPPLEHHHEHPTEALRVHRLCWRQLHLRLPDTGRCRIVLPVRLPAGHAVPVWCARSVAATVVGPANF